MKMRNRGFPKVSIQHGIAAALWIVIVSVQSAMAVSPTSTEFADARKWVAMKFENGLENKASSSFFSFTYDGKPAAELLATWKFKRASRPLDNQRTEHTIVYADPKTGLELRCVGIEYRDFPVVEWMLYFKNTGDKDTPILSDILPLDEQFDQGAGAHYVLNHNNGDVHKTDIGNYVPLRTELVPGKEVQFAGEKGLPTQGAMPYFNIEWGGKGLIVVLGWPGQWSARFTCDNAGGIRLRAGQQFTHFRLHPGEEVPSPRVVLLRWEGDTVRGQNVWRRWMIAHNMPRPNGESLKPTLSAMNSVALDYTGMTSDNQLQWIDRCLEEKLPIDRWWVDAGWYQVPKGSPWWTYGTWEVDKTRFPEGLKPTMDYAHAKGLGTVLWFCPESVRPGTELHTNHKDWLLGGGLLNLGNPDAYNWLVEHVDRYITELKLDVYRNDNDINPLDVWLAADAPDRQGICEIRHVTGFLAFYDELLKRHRNLLIDNCCAGGRRNDIETLRRSVPLWRSDHWGEPTEMQCQTYGLASWLPYFGHCGGQFDTYVFRSNMCPSVVLVQDLVSKNQDFETLRRNIDQWRRMAPNFLGDYYPLTPYSRAANAWMAWQFDRPELGEGVVQAFRRPECPQDSLQLRLQGLEPEEIYEVKNFDEKETVSMSGKELMSNGLTVTLHGKPAAALITYQKKK
ncbi:MAG: alpha-galactosidase [Phycisphaeraceae bacterium]|nr:alpha-galactosidase [Phycisphaeraceae bacterium]